MLRPITLLICVLGLSAVQLSAFTIIENFWELQGYASGKANLLLLDIDSPTGVEVEQEQFQASYSGGLETHFYMGNLTVNSSASYYGAEDYSFDDIYASFAADVFDISVGKQKTVWGFGSFFHPSYALELKDGENAELPAGATPWSSILNIPFNAAQLSLFAYFNDNSIELGHAPTWGGGSALFQTGIEIVELSFSGSVLAGSSINNKINLAGELRIDLSAGYIFTGSFGNVINLESEKHRYTPTGLVGISFSSSDGKQQFTIESYYDKGIYLSSRLSLQLMSGFNGSVLAQMDMQDRGIRLSTTLSFAPSGYFSTSFTITYLNARKGSHFDNHGAPLILGLNWVVSF